MHRVLAHFRQHASLPPDYVTREHMRSQYECTVPEDQLRKWRERFHSLPDVAVAGGRASDVSLLLVDGFLLYYSAQVRSTLDIPLFLRIGKQAMRERREKRDNYVIGDGTVWEDPPFYFDEILWPAYLEAHRGMFTGGDVENGAPAVGSNDRDGGPVPHLVLLDGEKRKPEQLVDDACEAIYGFLQGRPA